MTEAALVARCRSGDQAAGRLRALSPRATLGRGYAIVRSSSEIVRSATQVEAGDRVAVELAEGDFEATVDP